MKKLRLFNLLLLLSASIGFASISSFSTLKSSQNIIEVKADNEIDYDTFILQYTEIRNKQSEAGRPSACDATVYEYNDIMEIYGKLNQNDRQKVVLTEDPIQPIYTIGQYINELVKKFYNPTAANSVSKPKLDQSTTIIIAVVVSIFGMSAISVLYILKNKKVIE